MLVRTSFSFSSLSSGWKYQEVKETEQEENPGHRDGHIEVGGLRTEARDYLPESLDACQTRRFLSLLFWEPNSGSCS